MEKLTTHVANETSTEQGSKFRSRTGRMRLVSDRTLGAAGAVLGVLGVLLAVALQDVLSLTFDVIAYVVCLFGAWFFLGQITSLRKRALLGVRLLVIGLCFLLFGHAVHRQYDHEVDIRVAFKAPQFTWWRRQVIRWDLSHMRSYLRDLGLDAPQDLPPFDVGQYVGQMGWETPTNKPLNRSVITLPPDKVSAREEATTAYLQYSFQRTLNESINQHHLNGVGEIAGLTILQASFAAYFDSSYWGREFNSNPLPHLYDATFWEIRAKFGRDYADRLAAAAFRVMMESPEERPSNDWTEWFVSCVKTADNIVDGGRRWPEISQIIKDDGYH